VVSLACWMLCVVITTKVTKVVSSLCENPPNAAQPQPMSGSTSDGLAMTWSGRSARTAVPMVKNSVV
jgi:hypothetical protein